jgi:hypothetical protein
MNAHESSTRAPRRASRYRRALLAALIGAPLAVSFATEARAQVVKAGNVGVTVPIYTLVPRKIAVVAADWNDGAFSGNANATADALKKAGWIVHVLNDSTGNKDTRVIDMIRSVTGDASDIDQVLIDVNAHGGGQAKWYQVTDFNGQLNWMWMDPLEALAYPESASLAYPYSDPIAERAHAMSAFIPGGQSNLFANELESLAKDLDARKVPTTIIDHSCNGGNTVHLIEDIHSPNLCAIATAGVFTPGLTGYPATSNVITKGSSFEDVAKYIAATYDNEKHNVGDRLFSTGYRTGADGTMAIRENLANAIIATSTWPTQMRWTESFVARSPSSYTNYQPYVQGLPDGKGNRDTGFDPVRANHGGPGEAQGGGQGRWGLETTGEVRWFQNAINQFLADNSFTVILSGVRRTLHSTAVTNVANESNKTLTLVYGRRAGLDSLMWRSARTRPLGTR